jgi:mono/diheme cytochrome c family protein
LWHVIAAQNKIQESMAMKLIYRSGFCLLILIAGILTAASFLSRQSAASPAQAQGGGAPGAAQTETERGKYLVDDVGMCSECHTPRKANGELDSSRYLQGAAIWITPVHPNPNWAMRAPALAGFEGFTTDQGEKILENGVGPNGLVIRPPMHIYHMNRADALAIIAYLRSLPGNYPE